ncbi:MAG: hypothetical protein QOI74_3986, partial [Micromonosporaceae bacterium]|nr:hypothetical protein [Micromonosporaceae bacterium]
ILTELAANLGPHAPGNGADEIVQYLRANHFTIICGDIGCALGGKAPDTGPTQGQQTLW